MNTSGMPLTKPTKSARRVYISPVTQNWLINRKSLPVGVFQSISLTNSTVSPSPSGAEILTCTPFFSSR